jgi:hypothetical protein
LLVGNGNVIIFIEVMKQFYIPPLRGRHRVLSGEV